MMRGWSQKGWEVRVLIIAVVALIAAIAQSAKAGIFVDKRADWVAMTQWQKEAYVMGLFDGIVAVYPEGSAEAALEQRRQRCVAEMQMTNADLARLVDMGYQQDPATWGRPPIAMFMAQLDKACGFAPAP